MTFLPDTTGEELGADYEIIPPGKYPVKIVQSEITTTKSGHLWFKVELLIWKGELAGRKLFDGFLLSHDNEKAAQIGLRKLRSIKVAVGKPEAEDDVELWDIPIIADVGFQKDTTGEYSDKNTIRKYLSVEKAGAETTKNATVTKKQTKLADEKPTARQAKESNESPNLPVAPTQKGKIPSWRPQASTQKEVAPVVAETETAETETAE
jgi:hypothetical protein